jgi:hypothetical protein
MVAVTATKSAALMMPSQFASPGASGPAVPVGDACGIAVGLGTAPLGVALALAVGDASAVGVVVALDVRVGAWSPPSSR